MSESLSVNFVTKELKSILKTFGKFAEHNFRSATPSVVIAPPSGQSPSTATQLILNTDHAYVVSSPNSEFKGDANIGPYALDSERLLSLALTGKNTTLSWASDKSPLQVQDGKVSASLNVAVTMPDFQHLPQQMDSIQVPVALLSAIQKYADVPFSYFKATNKDTNPIHIKPSQTGNLEAHTDDSYSLIKIETDFAMSRPVEFKIAKYAFDALYSGNEDSEGQGIIGVNGFSIYVSNGEIVSVISGLNDDLSSFDAVFNEVGNSWLTSCDFVPKLLVEAVKPLISVIPKKDSVGSIINMSFKDQRAILSLRHKDVGEVLIDNVDGITNVYNENSIRNVVLHLHPKAFLDFTTMLSSVDTAKMYANNKLVYYEALKKVGENTIKIRYLFPTVQV